MVVDFGKKYSELAVPFCFMIKTISGGKQFEILFLCQFGKCNRVKNRHSFLLHKILYGICTWGPIIGLGPGIYMSIKDIVEDIFVAPPGG